MNNNPETTEYSEDVTSELDEAKDLLGKALETLNFIPNTAIPGQDTSYVLAGKINHFLKNDTNIL